MIFQSASVGDSLKCSDHIMVKTEIISTTTMMIIIVIIIAAAIIVVRQSSIITTMREVLNDG